MNFDLVLKTDFNVLECNFDDLEAKLKALMAEKYNIAVTEDTVKEAKKTRAEINAGKKALEQAWRERKAELEAPVKALNERAKAIFAICDESAKAIDFQVEQFEAKKRELAVALCEEYKNKLCEQRGIPVESVCCGNLNNLGYVTEKGVLSSQGKQAVESLVNAKALELEEQKRRELEEQLRIEKIKQEAVQEYCQKNQPQPMEQTDRVEAQLKPAPVEAKKESGTFLVNVSFVAKCKGEFGEELVKKIQDYFYTEISKNAKLSQALQNIEVEVLNA